MAATTTCELRAQATHLVVFQHGLWGNEKDFRNFQTLFTQYFPQDEVYAHISTCNATSFSRIFRTYDGIDVGGERLATEIMSVAEGMPRLTKFSIAGHSLGGLYARYCIGVLYARGFFENVEPMNFITLASPHLGIRRSQRTALNAVHNSLAPFLFDRTGQQFTLTDTVSDETLALSRSARKYPLRKRSAIYSTMESELLLVHVPVVGRVPVSLPVEQTEESSVEKQTEEPLEEQRRVFEKLVCTLEDGRLRIHRADSGNLLEEENKEENTGKNKKENKEENKENKENKEEKKEENKEENKKENKENKKENEEESKEENSCVAEIDLLDAEVTIVLPEHERPATLFESINASMSTSTKQLRSSSTHDEQEQPNGKMTNWDLSISSPSLPTAVTIRIPHEQLKTQWKWIAALSNACHGVQCRTHHQPQSPPPPSAPPSPPTLLSCLTRGQFIQALHLFRARTLYASIFHDLQVPYSCGAIRAFNPYRVENNPSNEATSPYYHHIVMRSLWNAPLLRDTLPEEVKDRANNTRSGVATRFSLVKALSERSHRSSTRRRNSSTTTRLHHSFSLFTSSSSSSRSRATTSTAARPAVAAPSSSSSSFSPSSVPLSLEHRLQAATVAASSSSSSVSSSSQSLAVTVEETTAPQGPASDPDQHDDDRSPSSSSSIFASPFSTRDTKRPTPFEDGLLLLDHADYAFANDELRDELRGMMLSLQSVGWRRIDVFFHSPLAHMKILAMQANPTKPLTKGLDVVHHVMDTFVL